MRDPAYRYCPHCAATLIEREIANAQRLVCPACGYSPFFGPRVVVVVVLHSDGQLLLAQRSHEPGQGLWNFCGGYVELGEPVEDAAIREVKEESGLRVTLDGLVGVYSAGEGSHVVIAYEARVSSEQAGQLTPQRDEVSALAFFPYDDLPPLAFAVHHEIVRDWRRLHRR